MQNKADKADYESSKNTGLAQPQWKEHNRVIHRYNLVQTEGQQHRENQQTCVDQKFHIIKHLTKLLISLKILKLTMHSIPKEKIEN